MKLSRPRRDRRDRAARPQVAGPSHRVGRQRRHRRGRRPRPNRRPAPRTSQPLHRPRRRLPQHHPTIGGKKVVLEYDTPTHEAPKATPAPAEDAAAVARARASYAAGNKRLFAGDAAGAVHAYQQALAAYPGYVAGYRGLGLAYTQQGDKAKALQAFHTYLSSVPGAKDAPLIKKRVTALSH